MPGPPAGPAGARRTTGRPGAARKRIRCPPQRRAWRSPAPASPASPPRSCSRRPATPATARRRTEPRLVLPVPGRRPPPGGRRGFRHRGVRVGRAEAVAPARSSRPSASPTWRSSPWRPTPARAAGPLRAGARDQLGDARAAGMPATALVPAVRATSSTRTWTGRGGGRRQPAPRPSPPGAPPATLALFLHLEVRLALARADLLAGDRPQVRTLVAEARRILAGVPVRRGRQRTRLDELAAALVRSPAATLPARPPSPPRNCASCATCPRT